MPEQHSLMPATHFCPAGIQVAAFIITPDESLHPSSLQINSPDLQLKHSGFGSVENEFNVGQLSVVEEQTAGIHFSPLKISPLAQRPHFAAAGCARHVNSVSPLSE